MADLSRIAGRVQAWSERRQRSGASVEKAEGSIVEALKGAPLFESAPIPFMVDTDSVEMAWKRERLEINVNGAGWVSWEDFDPRYAHEMVPLLDDLIDAVDAALDGVLT